MMAYVISAQRRNILHEVINSADCHDENILNGFTELLKLDTLVSPHDFLVKFNELKNTYPIIEQLCSQRGSMVRRFFNAFQGSTKTAYRYKQIVLELKNGCRSDELKLSYFNTALAQKASIGKKIHDCVIGTYEKTYTSSDDTLFQTDSTEFQQLTNFNHNIKYSEPILNHNLTKLSNTNPELLRCYVRKHPKYACLLNLQIDKAEAYDSLVNIEKVSIKTIKVEFCQELNIPYTAAIWEGSTLNPTIGVAIKTQYIAECSAARCIRRAYTAYHRKRKPYGDSLNSINQYSLGYCAGFTGLWKELPPVEVNKLEHKFHNQELSLLSDLRDIDRFGRIEHLNYTRLGLLTALSVISKTAKSTELKRLYSTSIKTLNDKDTCTEAKLLEIARSLIANLEFVAHTKKAKSHGIYYHYKSLYQLGQKIDPLGWKLEPTKYIVKTLNKVLPSFRTSCDNELPIPIIVDCDNVGSHGMMLKLTKELTQISIRLLDSNDSSVPIQVNISSEPETNEQAILTNYAERVNVYCKKHDYKTLRSCQQSFLLLDAVDVLSIPAVTGQYSQKSGDWSYNGAIVNGEYTGYGVMKWPGGGEYKGNFVNGVRSGYGVMKWPGGGEYKGDFVNGVRSGHGVMKWSDGREYKGGFVNNKRTGRGVMKWSDGREYEGDFVNDTCTGHGVMKWPDGREYKGDFANDKRTGHGVMKWPDGREYEGDFVNDTSTGHGVMK